MVEATEVLTIVLAIATVHALGAILMKLNVSYWAHHNEKRENP